MTTAETRTGITGEVQTIDDAVAAALESGDTETARRLYEKLGAIGARRDALKTLLESALAEKAPSIPATIEHTETPSRLITPDETREIMGAGRFFGADEIKKIYGVTFSAEELGKIPFILTEQEALNAARLGHMIALHTDTLGNSQSLNMLTLNDYAHRQDRRKLLFDTGWYKQGQPFAQTPDQKQWRETSIKPVPETNYKNYLLQTDLIVRYFTEEVSRGVPLRPMYQQAKAEYEQKRPEIEKLLQNPDQKHSTVRLPDRQPAPNWYVAAEMLENLAVTKLFRPTPVGISQDTNTFQASGQEILRGEYTSTSGRSSCGHLVYFGGADSGGARVGFWGPDDRYDDLHAVFSRGLSESLTLDV